MKWLIGLGLFMMSFSTYAAELPKPLPLPLQQGLERLANMDGFSCRFEQTIAYGDGSEQLYSGTLAVAKQGRFRWQYIKPYEQLYISNGDGIWLYEPDLMQVQWLKSLDAVDPVAMRLLEGRVQSHEITVLDIEKGVYHVRIAGDSNAGGGTELWLMLRHDGMPAWFESRDSLDNRNRMNLLTVQTGQPELKQFEFTVPEGVDVMDANGLMMGSE